VRGIQDELVKSAIEQQDEFARWLIDQLSRAWESGVMDALGKPWLDVPSRDSGFHRYGEAHIGTAVAAG
jgi:hypothetical protein